MALRQIPAHTPTIVMMALDGRGMFTLLTTLK
jgi:hypothetical protein